MSAKLRRTLGALGVAGLAGCELVAGIQDITLTDGGAPPDDATVAPQDSGSGSDVAASGDAAGNDAAATPDVRDAASGGDVRDAADAGDATLAADAGDTGSDAGDTGAGEADAAAVSSAVPLVGPDGGALLGPDGGPLLGELIDDIESETTPGWILARSGRVGTWFTYDDGTDGGIVPAPSALPSSIVMSGLAPPGGPTAHGAHVQGSGLATYAGLGVNLNASGSVKSTYDATANQYQGFVFWARMGGDSGTTAVTFAVPDRNTAANGGVCTLADGSTSGCGDYFSKSLTLTSSWQQFVIYFGQLGQAGWGNPHVPTGLDAFHLYSCQWQLSAGPSFDVWIEDVYFIDR